MPAFNSAAMLTAWEEGASRPPVSQAIGLLSAAWPDRPASTWARLSIGARDSALLDLQECMFGPDLEAIASCPRCGVQVELSFTTGQIRTTAPSRDRVTVEWDGHEVVCRLPTSEDLLALPRTSPEVALLERCVERVTRGGEPAPARM